MTISQEYVAAALEIADTTPGRVRIGLEYCQPIGDAVGHSPEKILADVAALLDEHYSTKPASKVGVELRELYRGKSPSIRANRARNGLDRQADLQRQLQERLAEADFE